MGDEALYSPRSSAVDARIEAPKAPVGVGVWEGVFPPHWGSVYAPSAKKSILDLQ